MASKPNPTAAKVRLDQLLVTRGLCDSLPKAHGLILAGQVLSGDRLLAKPGLTVPGDISLRLRGETSGYVSRSAHKLKGALDDFHVNLKDLICLDVGASTGGFTQVCLEAGAVRVFAIDVGRNLLDWKIKSDPRVVSLEGINFRNAAADLLPEKVDFVCIDCSFISLRSILPSVPRFMKENAFVIALFKPQHEVPRAAVGEGGIVNDDKAVEIALEEIAVLAKSLGLRKSGLVKSSLKGSKGNQEYLLYLQRE